MRTRLAVSVLSLLILAAGCSAGSGGGAVGGAGPLVGDGELAGTPDENSTGATASGAASDSTASPSAGSSSGARSSGSGNGTIQAGTLTAGVWDDNKNFDFFRDFRRANGTQAGVAPISDVEVDAAHDLALGPVVAKQKLDIQVVIDTTGSMGDEIAYLNKEFDAMVTTIGAKYPGAEQHWSLVAYKDKHDEYVARWFDFRSDPLELHAKLATLGASGGGDFPESPEVALGVAHRLSWRPDADTARLLFWVADAPHHVEDAAAMAASLQGARDKGIHIYPVAASGIDTFTELTMRSAAQLTGGRYVFLTDDSGVGESHEIPSVPCFFVTKLDQAILRMVDIEMTGNYREPDATEIVRTGGDPASGVCKVATQTVTVY